MSRLYVHCAGIFLSLIALFAGFFLLESAGRKPERVSAAPLASVSDSVTPAAAGAEIRSGTTTLAFVGDLMLDRSVRKSVVANFGGDYGSLFAKVGALSDADILFGNLEGPVSDIGTDRRNLYSFRMATSTLPAIAAAGFDAVSVANNHIGDWGRNAFLDTLVRVRAAGILPVGGAETRERLKQPQVIEKNGIRFGFLAATDVGPDWLGATASTSGILLASDPELPSIIASAKAKVDVLVISVHWGIEYETHSDARQRMLGRMMIDSGADLVIGSHPHVREEVEDYRGGIIAYSLGNFIFDQYFSDEVMKGGALFVTFDGKKIAGREMKTVHISKQSQPSLE